MQTIRKSHFIITVIAIFVMLSGCAKKNTTVEEIYHVLEKTVTKEKVFEQQQKPLVTLEKKEKNLYNQIIRLGLKQYDQIVKLSNEAIASVNQRKKLMDKETKSIEESEQEFKKIKPLIGKLEDPDLRKITSELADIMSKRYKAHEKLSLEYNDALKNDKKLYEMFKNKNLPLQELEGQVNKLNKIYKTISATNEEFNQLTEQYNKKKLSFYKKAGLATNK
ncbi:YkyA family protein [Neobacillus paridis]